MKPFHWMCLLFVCAFPVLAAPLEEAIEETRSDIQESTVELNQVRSEIQEERLPLARRLDLLRAESAALREEVKQLRLAKSLRDQERINLASDIDRLESEKEFIETVFQEYRRSLSTRVQTAESQFLQRQLPDDPSELWIRTSQWWDLRKNGYSFSGSALDDEGREISGTFLVLGPLGYFVGEQAEGIVISRPGSSLPGIYPAESTSVKESLRSLSEGMRASVPVDMSGGDAMKVLQAEPGWVEHLLQGGVVVIPLLILGALAFMLSLLKVWDLYHLQVSLGSSEAEQLRKLRESPEEPLLSELPRVQEPLASLLKAALQHRRASRENLEEILHEHVLAAVPRFEKSLGILAVLGGVAPLLGLLGTVTGMIHTFQLVTLFGSGNAKTLSGGISEALVTTELGLVIAIPILLTHALLARKAKVLLGELEHSGVSIVNLLHSGSISLQ